MTRSTLLPLLLLCLFAAACAPAGEAGPVDVAVSPEFAPDDAQVILDAVATWNAATHGQANLVASIGTAGHTVIRPADLAPGYLGDTRIAGGHWDVAIDLAAITQQGVNLGVDRAAQLQDTVEHEIGHSLGLQHEPGSLMEAAGYWGTDIDAKTMAQYCQVNGCE